MALVRTLGVAIALLATATGCNLLTGADDLVIDGSGEDGGDGSGGDTGSGAGTPNGSGSSGTGGEGTGAGGPAPVEGDATGVSIREVAFYQAVESTVFENGSPRAPSVSIVAGRPAVVRVFVDVASPSGAAVTARLYIGEQAPIEVTSTSLTTSSDSNYGSTINFDVPGAALQPGATWRVELKEGVETSAGANPAASTPDSNLQVQVSNTLKVKLIPVQYQADGSNRMPDTSAGQVQTYRDLFMALYPTANVEVTVGDVFPWNQSIDPFGNGWEALLNAISTERQQSNATFDEFYYGIFEPESSFSAFCGGGCVAGLGFVGDPNGEYSRAAIGLGFSGGVAAETAVHEVGHNHGRPHSPCGGAAGADPGYPHDGGDIGVWGMDIFTHELVSPGHKDFMGYCSPTWISDYVFEEILAFMQDVGGQQLVVPPEAMNKTFERVSFGPSGSTFLAPLTMKRPPMGSIQTVTVTDESGEERQVQGTFYRYDHLDGGVLFVEKPATAALTSVRLSVPLGGQVHDLFAAR